MKITNVFVGTVGQEPRSGSFEDGRAWTNLRIAVNHDYFNGATGEVVNRGVSWFDVSAYGALARNVGFSVVKGDSIIVVGELRLREWEKDGRNGTSGTIIADVVGPNLLFGVAKYTRSSSLTPDAQAAEAGDGEGSRARGRTAGAEAAWGGLSADQSATPSSATASAAPQDADESREPALATVGAPAGESAGAGHDEAASSGEGPPF